MMVVTYVKLRSGKWGVRVEGRDDGSLGAGAVVEVVTKAGVRKRERLGVMVWRAADDSVALFSLAREATETEHRGRRGGTRGTRTGCACGSVEEYSKPSDCWTCRHDADDL